jgi:hypothetical protein
MCAKDLFSVEEKKNEMKLPKKERCMPQNGVQKEHFIFIKKKKTLVVCSTSCKTVGYLN